MSKLHPSRLAERNLDSRYTFVGMQGRKVPPKGTRRQFDVFGETMKGPSFGKRKVCLNTYYVYIYIYNGLPETKQLLFQQC